MIGKDTRLSGYMIEYALVAGFTSVGMDALVLGPMPTPAVAMLTRSMRADLGVMISASHNPYEDNGIKLFGPDGHKLSDEIEAEIEPLIDSDLDPQARRAAELGRARRIDDVRARYIEFAKHTLPRNMSFEGMRVVIDCANGAAYKVAPEALVGAGRGGLRDRRRAGRLQHQPRLSARPLPQALRDKVRELRADIGIALDGDADRVIIVDENGHVVDGDQLMAVVAESWREQDLLTKPGIVATIMSNLGLERYLSLAELSLDRTAVGDRYVLERMREGGYNIGGEQSGHVILSDYSTTGDGLVDRHAGAGRGEAARPAGERSLPRLRAAAAGAEECALQGRSPLEGRKSSSTRSTRRAERLGNEGRLVIRPSGTEPVIRVMAEGDDRALIEEIVGDVCDALRASAEAA